MLPLGASAVTVGFGLLITFSRPPLDLRGSLVLVPLGHALVAIPLVIAVTLPVLRSLDPRLREVAATLGASPWRTWRTVDGRALAPALAVGAGLAAAVSLGRVRGDRLPRPVRASPTLPGRRRPAAGPPGRGQRRDGGRRGDPAHARDRRRRCSSPTAGAPSARARCEPRAVGRSTVGLGARVAVTYGSAPLLTDVDLEVGAA